MDNKFKVAVIVPTYNLENIIDRTLTNLSNQKGIDDIQVIVIDDGSSDETLSIVHTYSKTIPNLVIRNFQTPSGGASRARNLGIELSNSEYIAFLDGDDYYGDDAIWAAYEQMNLANAAIGDLKVVHENRGKGISYPDNLVHYDHDIINDRQYRIMGPWKIYSTDLLKKNDIKFNEKVHIGEDRVFNVHAYIHSENKIIELYDRDYYHLTGGEHEHVTDRLTDNAIPDIYDFFEEILKLTSVSHQNVDDDWLYKFKMGFVDKTQANKWHYKIMTNLNLPYTFRSKVFYEGKRILNSYLTQNDLQFLKKFYPKWAWFTDLMMNHDFSFFNYVYEKIKYVSTIRNYNDSYISNGYLLSNFGKEKGQKININIGIWDSLIVRFNDLQINYKDELEFSLQAKSRLYSDDFSIKLMLKTPEGSVVNLDNHMDFSQILFSGEDEIYFVHVAIENNGYKLSRNVKKEDFIYDFEEIFHTINNIFDGKMRVHFYISGVNNLKVRIKKIN